MAKKMRTINNPLDRQTRNDINYNFSALEENIAAVENSQSSNSEQVIRIENDITKLKQKDKELEDLITDNRAMIESMDLDLIKLQGDTTEAQGLEAKRQGEKAEQQGNVAETKGNAAEAQGVVAETKGNKAEQLGNYAKEMGDYAKEKAEYAAEKTSEIEQAHTDLSQIKVDAVDATQSANTQAEYAKEQGDYAKLVGDEVADKLDQVDIALQHTIAQGIDAETKGNVAKEQGDYAQSVIDSYKHDGDWQGSVEYKKNQEVLFNGSTYRALEDNKGTQPTDKSVWQLIAQRGVDGEGAVSTVNNLSPDETGNVDLGNLATQEYVDNKIGDVDLSALETKEDAVLKLTEAKEYTDTKTTNMETTTGAQAKVDTHANKTDNPHNVTKSQIGLSAVLNYGVATQAEAQAGTSNVKYMTPLRTKEAINSILGSSLTDINNHITNKSNPHGVTKAQVGLSNVDNVKQASKVEHDRLQSQVTTHLADGTSHAKTARFVIGTSTAGWTAADCNYLCDGTADQMEINAAITALPATGGEIIILDGEYHISESILINKDNVNLIGSGTSTIFNRGWRGDVDNGVIEVSNSSGCKVGYLMVNGNYPTYQHYTNNVYLNNCNNISLVEINSTNARESHLFLNSSHDNILHNNTVRGASDFGTDCIKLVSSNRNIITSNKLFTGRTGIRVQSSSSHNLIEGNHVQESKDTGMYIYQSDYTLINSNITLNCNTGIDVQGSKYTNVMGNIVIKGDSTPSDYGNYDYTIHVRGGSDHALITSNLIMGKAVAITSSSGVVSVNNKWN